MNNNVTTLETSRRLKAAGFPQETYAAWYHFIDTRGEVVPDELRLGDEKDKGFGPYFAAPTAQEIADQLPNNNQVGRTSTSEKYYAKQYAWNEGGTDVECIADACGDTMAEALALLWLKLQEAK